jgi:hypothetical protein
MSKARLLSESILYSSLSLYGVYVLSHAFFTGEIPYPSKYVFNSAAKSSNADGFWWAIIVWSVMTVVSGLWAIKSVLKAKNRGHDTW